MNVKITTNSQIDGNPTFNLATVWLRNIGMMLLMKEFSEKMQLWGIKAIVNTRIDYLLVAALFVFHQEYHLVT